MPVPGAAPCQCFSPGVIHTVSPALISLTGPPQVCTRPTPEITCSVCPRGWVCHAVRAPGSKVTRFARIRAGGGASMMGSCHTVPVKASGEACFVGNEPAMWISMEPSRATNFDAVGTRNVSTAAARMIGSRVHHCALIGNRTAVPTSFLNGLGRIWQQVSLGGAPICECGEREGGRRHEATSIHSGCCTRDGGDVALRPVPGAGRLSEQTHHAPGPGGRRRPERHRCAAGRRGDEG